MTILTIDITVAITETYRSVFKCVFQLYYWICVHVSKYHI